MLRRLLSPVLAAALVLPASPASYAFAEDDDGAVPAEKPYTPPFSATDPASIDDFIGVRDFAAMKPTNTAQSAGAELFGALQPKLDEAKKKAGDKWDAALEEALYARIAERVREQLLKGKEEALGKAGGDALKKLLESEALAKVLGEEGHARRLLFDALQSGNTEKLQRLLDVHAKLGGGDFKEMLAKIDLLMKGSEEQRKYGELLAKYVDGGKVTLGEPPAPPRDGENPPEDNERRFPRDEQRVASLGFDGGQTYGRRGERRVLDDEAGNLMSVQIVSIRRPDGTMDDSINVANIKNPGDPQGDTFSLRGDFEKLKAGVQTTVGGVAVTLKLVATPDGDYSVEVSGPGGAFKTTSEPPGPPMSLNQMFAYRAAKVYQYGRVVEIGGKEYYVSPEAYSTVMGEGDAAAKVGLGQFTYWPVEDMRKIFGEPEVDPETFDYKQISLEGTKYAGFGLRALRPDLSATVVRREGAQDVQILRASAGQDAQGRWWDAVFENGQYVIKPGAPPQDGAGPGTPGEPGQQIPPEKLDPLVAGLNKQLQSRVPGAKFEFAGVNGRLAFSFDDPKGEGKLTVPLPFSANDANAGFLDDTSVLAVDIGAGGTLFTDLSKGFGTLNAEGGVAYNVAGVLKQKPGGFEITNFGENQSINDFSVFQRLISNRLTSINPAFQYANQNRLQDLINTQLNGGLKFHSASGSQSNLVVSFVDGEGKEKFYTYQKGTDDSWTAKEGEHAATVRDEVSGPPGSIAAQLQAGLPADNPAFQKAPTFDGYSLLSHKDTKGGGIYFRKGDPSKGITPDLQMLFVLKEDPKQPDIASRTASKSAWAEQRVWDLRTILSGNPVSGKSEWTAADFAGMRFNDTFQYPVEVSLNKGASPGAMSFEPSANNSAGAGVVFLTIVPPGKTQKQVMGWVAAWGGVDPTDRAKFPFPQGAVAPKS